jgi:HlyD family secretion protein
MRPRTVWTGVVLLVAAAGLFLAFRGRGNDVRYATASVDRGDIADVVGATGVLQAVTTVQVGSQVSGTIKELLADFNSNVKKGHVIARLDPALFQARVAQAQANVASSRADVERARAAIVDAKQKYGRAQELAKQDLLPPSDLESAKAAYDSANAQLQANVAAVSQAEAALNQAQVDLGHSVITAPIDGVVLARNVDVGQTVAASFQAPVLFAIANDLTQMQVNASIDEADIGRVKAGQDVMFRVDAFPDQTFRGRLEQVRLQPVTAQNVVTYNTIVAVDNKDLRLMPGMTATVSVVVNERKDALRVPAAALRFRPEGFEDMRGPGGGRARPAAEGARPGGDPGSGVAPDAGKALARGTSGDAAPSAPTERAAQSSGGEGGAGRGGPGRSAVIFVPGPDGRPEPRRVRLGISDGRFVEVLDGLEEGQKVVTGVEEAGRPRTPGPSPSGPNNPFQPPRPNTRPRQ